MEATDAFELSPYNIEEIIIKTRQPKEYIKDKSYHPKENKKGSYLKDLRISTYRHKSHYARYSKR